MESIAKLKVAYTALFALFSCLFASMLLAIFEKGAEPARLVQVLTALGATGTAIAWLGWTLARRLGFSRSDAAAVALGSVWGGINVFIFAWVMLKRAPATPPA